MIDLEVMMLGLPQTKVRNYSVLKVNCYRKYSKLPTRQTKSTFCS